MPEIQIGKFKFSLVKAITVIGLLAGLIVGIVEGIIVGVREYDKYTKLQTEVTKLKKHEAEKHRLIISLESELSTFKKFMDSKQNTFAVGFRVTIDEDGKKVKGYKNWDGETKILYRDGQMSDYYGIDTYFWVDDDGEKIHVW
jgi:hypothetical protein